MGKDIYYTDEGGQLDDRVHDTSKKAQCQLALDSWLGALGEGSIRIVNGVTTAGIPSCLGD